MNLDTSGFWRAVEGRETVTYHRKTGEATFAPPVVVEDAKRRAPRKGETSGELIAPRVDLVWHLWADKLAGIVPKIGDVIRDVDSVRWTVVGVDIHSFTNRYRVECVREQ